MGKFTKMLTMTLVLATILLVSINGTVFANGRIESADYAIEVSPNILNICSYGNAGNIHTNIPDKDLTGVTLEVNGEEINEFDTSTDSLGHLVISFDINTVKGILVPDVGEIAEEAKFELTFIIGSGSFIVEDAVTVISVP